MPHPATSPQPEVSSGTQAQPGARPLLVLVHGTRFDARSWHGYAQLLPQADVVAVDLPGHGTRMAQPFTLEAADATIQGASERLRAAGVARIAVVGLSLGGYLSLRWAVRTETPPEALVLSSCTARPGGLGNRGFVGVTHAFRALPGDGAARVSVPWARAWVGAEGAQDIVAGGVGVEGQTGRCAP